MGDIASKSPNIASEDKSCNFLCAVNVLKKKIGVAYFQSNNPSWYEAQHESLDLGAWNWILELDLGSGILDLGSCSWAAATIFQESHL